MNVVYIEPQLSMATTVARWYCAGCNSKMLTLYLDADGNYGEPGWHLKGDRYRTDPADWQERTGVETPEGYDSLTAARAAGVTYPLNLRRVAGARETLPFSPAEWPDVEALEVGCDRHGTRSVPLDEIRAVVMRANVVGRKGWPLRSKIA